LLPIGTQSTVANKLNRNLGNPYLGKLAKPTQGPFKIIDVQQLPINGTVLIERSLNSVEHIIIH
jgi:hypothetical protein